MPRDKGVQVNDPQRAETFFKKLDEGYGILQQNPEEWADELRERAQWDCTLMDGLRPEDLCPPLQGSN